MSSGSRRSRFCRRMAQIPRRRPNPRNPKRIELAQNRSSPAVSRWVGLVGRVSLLLPFFIEFDRWAGGPVKARGGEIGCCQKNVFCLHLVH